MDDAKSSGVVAGTLITLADGSTKPVEQLVPGDEVRSRDGETDTVVALDKVTAQPLIRLNKTSGGHSLACSPTQTLLTAAGGSVDAQDAVGEWILCEGGSTCVVSFTSEVEAEVFSPELSRGGPYIANGLHTGGRR